MTFPSPTVESIGTTLIAAFNGAKTSLGELCATEAINRTDAAGRGRLWLLFRGATFTSDDWNGRKVRVRMMVPATLKLDKAGEHSPIRYARRAIDDLYRICVLVKGLPVDETGKVIPYSRDTPRLLDEKKIQELADRGGPKISSAVIREQTGANHVEVDVRFDMEFLADYDPSLKYPWSVAVIGLSPSDPANSNYVSDWTPEAVTEARDLTGTGRHDTPDPVLSSQGVRQFKREYPPFPGDDIPDVAGADPDDLLRSITVVPYTAAIAIAGTQQCQAIAMFQSGGVLNVNTGATWASSTPATATVSSTGLVTGVAAGTTNITCTYLGVQSSACAVTVS